MDMKFFITVKYYEITLSFGENVIGLFEFVKRLLIFKIDFKFLFEFIYSIHEKFRIWYFNFFHSLFNK